MFKVGGFRTGACAAALVALALVGAACSSSSNGSTTTTKPSSSSIPTQAKDSTIAATVPAAIRSKGSLTIALDATYAPDEFIASNGTTIIGMDADLAYAITQILGLKANLVNATFDTIIPGLQSGKYDMGDSSFTDTAARQQVVDFVDYFVAGEGFYIKAGGQSFNGLSSLCGHTVSVEDGTTEQTDAQTQAKACTSAGKPTVNILSFGNQSQANLAVSSGRAQVGFADSQVAAYIVSTSNGVFQNSGQAFEVAPYGLALPKGNGMAAPVEAAVNLLIQNGTYKKILDKWGVQAGAVSQAQINNPNS